MYFKSQNFTFRFSKEAGKLCICKLWYVSQIIWNSMIGLESGSSSHQEYSRYNDSLLKSGLVSRF